MSPDPRPKVLFFDVFGTCVQQRKPVADELWKAATAALESDSSSISDEVRTRAQNMTYEQWFDFGGEWNKDIDVFTADMKSRTSNVDWHAVDAHRLTSLHKLLTQLDLLIAAPTSSQPPQIQPGSLFNDSQLQNLSKIWHRLPPWPDTIPGLTLLNKHFATATLSNTHEANMQSIVSHSSLPFQHIFTSSMFDSYKPNAKVYRGGAEKLGVKPEECALVAAHLGDLKGAKAAGFGLAIYVQRPLEEKQPDLVGQEIPDLVIEEGSGGFVRLAEVLGAREG